MCCAAMSLCVLIYSKVRKIASVDDMIQIMIVDNQLYSSLSLLIRQSVLMLTELPRLVTYIYIYIHPFSKRFSYREIYR